MRRKGEGREEGGRRKGAIEEKRGEGGGGEKAQKERNELVNVQATLLS